MKKQLKRVYGGTKGFTLVEILVVVAVLAAMAVVAGVYIGKSLDDSKTEAYATELYDIRVAVSNMLHESEAGILDSAQSDISDMDLVTADSGVQVLSDYLDQIHPDGNVLTGCTYSFTVDGTVTQVSTP